jgi:hypothetical protein
MPNTPALHARRRNHASDEEMIIGLVSSSSLHSSRLDTASSTSVSPTKRKRLKQSLQELQISYVIVSVFVFVGITFGYVLLHHQHRKVIVHVIRNPWAHGRAAFRIATTRRRRTIDGFHHHFYSGNPKFVTVILPSVINAKNRPQRLETIHDTWGPSARAIYVVHDINEFAKASHLTMSVDAVPYDRYSYPQNLLLPTHIDSEQGIARLFYTIQTIYERVNPDFAFFVNDHTYVIPSHVCHYLEMKSPDLDLYAGHALKNDQNVIFNSGAAGYILSRETMKQFVQRYHDKNDEHCFIDLKTTSHSNQKWLDSNPGLAVLDCLHSMGISAIDTRAQHKYHRFHAFPLVRMVSGDVDLWYSKKHQMEDIPTELRSTTSFDETYSTLLFGTDCCSTDSISFHYVESKECKGLYNVQQALFDNPQLTDPELQIIMEQNWPTDAREIGGYSRPLPKLTDHEQWTELLYTIRNISTKDTQSDC